MTVCIHIPSRGRPKQLLDAVTRWRDAVQDTANSMILVSLDADDWSDHREDYQALNSTPALVMVEKSACKIEAINRDLDTVPWDVLVVASDDLFPMTPGVDQAIRTDFANEADDLDAVFWYADGLNTRICCHPVLGRKYYERDGYVYHRSYRGYYCDDEATIVAQHRGKLYKSTSVKFEHNHPNARTRKPDATDARAKQHLQQDYRNFARRMGQGFPR